MSAYVNRLNSEVAKELARNADEQAAVAQAARDRLTPLEDRLARLLASIPEEVQREGIPLGSLQAGLRGRWRGTCHPGELGTALRKMGFSRVRRWRGGGAFSAVWCRPR